MESSYPVAGGVAAMINTEKSSVRLTMRGGIRFRNRGLSFSMRKNFNMFSPGTKMIY
jgi:hypothetical protein